MCMWDIVHIVVIIGKLEQVIWMLLGNSFSISESKPQPAFLSCHLSYSKRFLKLAIYIVYCLLDRGYNIYSQENIVNSIYFIVYEL